MTRHEAAGLPKAAAADTVTGRSEPTGGRACLQGSKAPDRGALGPPISLSVHSGGLAPVLSPLRLPLPTDIGS